MKKTASFLLSAALLFPFATLSHAAGGLTYQEAIDKALGVSKQLKSTQLDIERKSEDVQKAGEDIRFLPAEASASAAADQAFTAYVARGVAYDTSKQSLTTQQDTIAYNVRTAYNKILQEQEKKKFADLSEKNAHTQSYVSFLKQQAGMAGKIEADRAEKLYDAEKKNNAVNDTNLRNAYEAFNQLLELRPEERPVLEEKPEYKPLGEIDVEAHITGINAQNPTLFQADKGIDLARLDLKLYDWNRADTTYKAKQLDVEKAKTGYSIAKEGTEQAIRDIYANIRALEEQYKALEANLAVAQDAVHLAQVQFDVGVGTKVDLETAELKVAELKQKQFDIIVNHDNLVQAFNKPWVLASGGGAK
ncbi:TolC family protein [Aneurinibacillus aneurinilyticus]|uniref:Outer membrane efflux protein n=1 Tax=Aneurinibacillus aneurinilyticus ATCC 12856 TaxID=649747 RepID=U1YC97_ANEAE|nr:TolC family protein [Aneurinibacillus aneurinilyticus]ERI08431.1 hypothetical protein HMPREF0083_03490 [Aneurinibacillus aneurinilyticus ATCC 12856]MED0706445.1 TolC family protein [Aneurinibacillus aneurinilyticus]MED0723719.1 TolC family protein [Aneurinibacillus aneurinilyticus]MED0730600.1 TolC family protein [Aneurinibacillus aneurinilyticus]MED0741071.1 TolC family protein [Aneurinibacillus aneurinilyticus]